MGQTILTAEQQKALNIIAQQADISSVFYLSGGTALAEFYLGHRYSDDLDFFTDQKDFPQLTVEKTIQDIQQAVEAESIEYRKIYDRHIFFLKKGDGELKIEFTYYPFARLEVGQNHQGLIIDSLKDIAANKWMALIDRIEPKDFVDLYFIIKTGLTLEEIQKLVEKKFHFHFDPIMVGSELAKIGSINTLPRMIKPISIDELKNFYTNEAKKLKSNIFE